ncbi:MAG: ABC transporter substrate-binding protein [Dehalococcoidales bacterium]|nr:ABC transporter substrate-binding protein [Dehalococcoidales bacterium]
MKKIILVLLGILLLTTVGACAEEDMAPVGMAVEFMDHASCAYISQDKGWFVDEGLNLTAYESYATGMALASALARGDIGVAYICLVPAINAYANAGVPLKVVAGTHKYGYGLVVDADKIKTVKDLEKPDVRIGCVREGGAVDVLFHKVIDTYNVDEGKVMDNVQRMNPARQVIAIESGQLDAAFLPEQWATMAEESGFTMLLMGQDVWPQMQGSVVVVKEDLIEDHPEIVSKLVKVSQRATDWANQHPAEAAEVVARQLQASGSEVLPVEIADTASGLAITGEVLLRSMKRMEFTTDIDPQIVQDTIDYIAGLGYIQSGFDAGDILDLRFLEGDYTQ